MEFLEWVLSGLLVYGAIVLIRLPTYKNISDFKPDPYEAFAISVMGPIGCAFVIFQCVNTFNNLNEKRINRERTVVKNQNRSTES